MYDSKEIGNKIKNLRKISGYTQEEIAEKLDIGDRIKISRIENGKQSMTANEMIKFCKLLKSISKILQIAINSKSFKIT